MTRRMLAQDHGLVEVRAHADEEHRRRAPVPRPRRATDGSSSAPPPATASAATAAPASAAAAPACLRRAAVSRPATAGTRAAPPPGPRRRRPRARRPRARTRTAPPRPAAATAREPAAPPVPAPPRAGARWSATSVKNVRSRSEPDRADSRQRSARVRPGGRASRLDEAAGASARPEAARGVDTPPPPATSRRCRRRSGPAGHSRRNSRARRRGGRRAGGRSPSPSADRRAASRRRRAAQHRRARLPRASGRDVQQAGRPEHAANARHLRDALLHQRERLPALRGESVVDLDGHFVQREQPEAARRSAARGPRRRYRPAPRRTVCGRRARCAGRERDHAECGDRAARAAARPAVTGREVSTRCRPAPLFAEERKNGMRNFSG